MYRSNLQLDKFLAHLKHIIIARGEFPTALEQVQFELAFTDIIQTLLVQTNENLMKNLTLHLTMD